MSDIRYKWLSDKAVGLDDSVMLPQFKILGYSQKEREVPLSTGKRESEKEDLTNLPTPNQLDYLSNFQATTPD